MLTAFLFGFLSAFAAIGVLIAVAGKKVRPLLHQKLEALKEERRTTMAKAVAQAASVDKVKVSTNLPAKLMSTPAHIETNSCPVKLVMLGQAITISTNWGAAKEASPPTTPGAPAPPPRKDRVLATLGAKRLKATMDRKDRCVVVFTPADGAEILCEVEDVTAPGSTERRKVQWRSLRITYGSAREAERWASILNPNHKTPEWQEYIKTLPDGAYTSLNLLVARILFENTSSSALDDLIYSKISKKLRGVKLPKPISGELHLVSVSFGGSTPLFTNSQFVGASANGEIAIDVDIMYRGGFTLVLNAAIDLGPITLPDATITIKIKQVSGKAHLTVGAPPSNKMWLGFHEQPNLELEFHQDISVPSQLFASVIRDIDLSEVVSEVVKVKLFEDMILPFQDDLPIPNVGPTPPSSPDEAELVPPGKPAQLPQLSSWDDADKPVAAKTAARPPAPKTAPPPVNDSVRSAPTTNAEREKAQVDAALKAHTAAVVPRPDDNDDHARSKTPEPSTAAGRTSPTPQEARTHTPEPVATRSNDVSPSKATDTAAAATADTEHPHKRTPKEVIAEKAAKARAAARNVVRTVDGLVHHNNKHHDDDSDAGMRRQSSTGSAASQSPAATPTAKPATVPPATDHAAEDEHALPPQTASSQSAEAVPASKPIPPPPSSPPPSPPPAPLEEPAKRPPPPSTPPPTPPASPAAAPPPAPKQPPQPTSQPPQPKPQQQPQQQPQPQQQQQYQRPSWQQAQPQW